MGNIGEGTVSGMTARKTVVLHVGGLQWATSARGIERVLAARPGVVTVEANAVSQTASVTFDPSLTGVGDLEAWVRECGYHCAGMSLPSHVCAPDAAPPAWDR